MTKKEKAEKAGWIYDYSQSLKQAYSWRKTDTGIEIYTSDKVRYSAKEVKIISDTIGEITTEVHKAKKIFSGTIIENNA